MSKDSSEAEGARRRSGATKLPVNTQKFDVDATAGMRTVHALEVEAGSSQRISLAAGAKRRFRKALTAAGSVVGIDGI